MQSIVILAVAAMTACVAEIGDGEEDEDPAGELGDQEWLDEGPLAEDEASDADDVAVGSHRERVRVRCVRVHGGRRAGRADVSVAATVE